MNHAWTRSLAAALVAAMCAATLEGMPLADAPIIGLGLAHEAAPRELKPGHGHGAAVAVDGTLACATAPVLITAAPPFIPGLAGLYRRDERGLWRSVATLTAGNDYLDRFGTSVALRVPWLAIGATGNGTVSIWSLDSEGTPSPSAEIITGPQQVTWFGHATRLSADRLVVSAPLADGEGVDEGRVYVWRRDGAQWVAEATLAAPSPQAGSRFGWSLALNEEGTMLAVGAPNTAIDGVGAIGTVHLFVRDGVLWEHAATLTPGPASVPSRFGSAVEFRADGERLAVGGPAGGLFASVGRVSVFDRAGDAWTLASVIEGNTAGGCFGGALAWRGDLLAAAAPGTLVGGYDGGSPSNGAVRILRDDAGTWTTVALLTDTGGTSFGSSLAATTDGLLIGAPNAGGSLNGSLGKVRFQPLGDVAGDCDGDGLPNGLEAEANNDCDGNQVPDACELAADDCDGSGTLDRCDGAAPVHMLGGSGGSGLISLLPSDPYECAFVNHLVVPSDSTGIIDAMDVRFARLQVGATLRIAIWSDPSGSGQPASALLLYESPITPQWMTSDQRFDIPALAIGPPGTSFFVGVAWTVPTFAPTCALAPNVSSFTVGQSFFVTGPLPLDLAHPASAIVGPITSIAQSHPRIGAVYRSSVDLNGDGTLDACVIPGDLNGDGIVGAADVAMLLGTWGACSNCAADLDHDGTVGVLDLAILLGAWTA